MSLCRIMGDHQRVFVYWGIIKPMEVEGLPDIVFVHDPRLPWVVFHADPYRVDVSTNFIQIEAFCGSGGRSIGVDGLRIKHQP